MKHCLNFNCFREQTENEYCEQCNKSRDKIYPLNPLDPANQIKTLGDEIAIAVLPALITAYTHDHIISDIVKMAYDVADAALEARLKNQPTIKTQQQE